MSSESAVLGAVTIDPTSTSDLYERVGYGELARAGLIPYRAFRAELERLESTGAVASETAADGSTMWRLTAESPGQAGPILD